MGNLGYIDSAQPVQIVDENNQRYAVIFTDGSVASGISLAGVQIDPRQVRALTGADIVTSNQGTAGALSNGWPVKVTDGTNVMPAGDAAARGIYARIVDSNAALITLGQKVMASSLPVAIALDQTSIPVTTEGLKATYSAAVSGFVPPAAATDIFTITGSATKVIRITKLTVACTTSAGSGIAINAAVIKRSTAGSGGTSTTMTNVPHDSNDVAGTAVVKAFTANPTVGTIVGNLRTSRFQINTAGTSSNELVFEMGTRPAKTVVLRGTSQQVAVNFGGATITNPICSISIEWTEEA